MKKSGIKYLVRSTVPSSCNDDVHRHICLVPVGVARTEIHGDRVCIVKSGFLYCWNFGPSSWPVPDRQKYTTVQHQNAAPSSMIHPSMIHPHNELTIGRMAGH